MFWHVAGAGKAVLVGVISAVVVTAAITMTAPGADAKSTYESPYGYDRTWNAALRLVRVDNGWKINEKDDQNGYLLFDYKSPESTKVTPGTLELVRGRDSDAPVNVLVQLPQMPHAHEQVMLDELARKMRREYGDPPEHKKKKKNKDDDHGEPPEAGADAPAE
jgi:hypothetical protein